MPLLRRLGTLLLILFNGSGIFNVGDLPLNGAHHRPLLTIQQLDQSNCAWAAGDFASYGHDLDANVQLAEIGVCHDFIPDLRFGVGVGKSFVDQDLAFGGKSDLDGEYIIAELDYKFSGFPIVASVTGLYGQWDADIRRGYIFGGSVSSSAGQTDLEGYSLRTRLDWLNAVSFAGVSLSPRVGYTVHNIDVDAYREKGGPDPITFNSRSQTTHQIRFGVDAAFQLTGKILLRGMLEGVHSFDGDTNGLSGNFNNAGPSFALAALNDEQTWGRVGAEIDYSLTDSVMLSGSVNGSTEGDDPDVSGGVSLKIDF